MEADMSAEQEKWISIMIVPEDGTGMRKWRVTSRNYSMFKVAFWFTCFFLFVGFISMVSLGILYGKLRYYKMYNQQLIEATAKLDRISERLDRYEERENKLRTILGGDLELPEPVAIDQGPADQGTSPASDNVSLTELEKAIAEEEARLRKLPTMWPVDAWQVSEKFLNTGDPRADHLGIDILAASKTGVVASADGKVIFADIDERFGNMIVIDHINGWQTKYGHLESILVKPGAFVSKGHLIAVFGGSGGVSTGPHLHFGMIYKGQPVDPLIWLEDRPIMNIAEGTK